MLIRNAKMCLPDGRVCPVEVRLMHGAVREIGDQLRKGLYEAELDLAGDVLRPARVLRQPICAAEEASLRALCRELYRQGVSAFAVEAPEAVLNAVSRHPARHAAVPYPPALCPEEEHALHVGLRSPLARWTAAGFLWLWWMNMRRIERGNMR